MHAVPNINTDALSTRTVATRTELFIHAHTETGTPN
jgi:hypothetical protein